MNYIYLFVATRFVDRDMVMRFHWGLGVGHVYSHADSSNADTVGRGVEEDEDYEQNSTYDLLGNDTNVQTVENIIEDEDEDEENLGVAEELGLEDRETDIWADSDDGDEPGISNGEGYESSVGEEEMELEATYSGDYND